MNKIIKASKELRDLTHNLTLVTYDLEVKEILTSIGANNTEYNSLLVGIHDGEYTEVWGLEGMALDTIGHLLYRKEEAHND